MNTLVFYYSLTGNSAALAEQLAQAEDAALGELRDAHKPGVLKAYTKGCLYALRGKPWAVRPLSGELQTALAAAERLVIVCPVWAGNVPPAVNALLAQLPQGVAVEFKLVSASGQSKCAARLEASLQARGARFAALENIKATGK
jgi:NAD(P)H-dependent FMN reductase